MSSQSQAAVPRREKRSLILEAAIRVFARVGYHRARISDIAREAGIAYGLVYHYFRNKEEILDTIFQERWKGFLETLEEIESGPGPLPDKLAAIAGVILSAYRLRPDWVKVLVLEIQRSSRFAEPGQIRAVGRLFQIVARILRRAQEEGVLRDDLDPEVACFMFVGSLEIVITGLVLDVIRIEDGPDAEQRYTEKVARTVVEIFLRGASKEAQS